MLWIFFVLPGENGQKAPLLWVNVYRLIIEAIPSRIFSGDGNRFVETIAKILYCGSIIKSLDFSHFSPH